MPARLPRNLVKRGDVYYVRVMIDGRRVWRSTGHTTEKSAIRKADEIKVQLRNDKDFGKGEAPLFRDWAKLYLEVYSSKKRAPWRDSYSLRPAIAALGRFRLDDITPSMCVRFLTQREASAAPATVNLERAVLGTVFQKAVDDELISKNPWRKTTKLKVGARIRVLTNENELTLREVLSPRLQRWLTFMLGTGLRLAEARTITAAEIDWERRLIHVPEEGAKGGKARQVPLFPEVAAVIKAELAASGRLWNAGPQYYAKQLKVKADAAKIPHLSPHDLRHTFATRYLRGGGNIFTLSKILGHASVTMTEKTYVHLLSTDIVKMSEGVDLGLAS